MSWAATAVISIAVGTGYQVERGISASREQRRASRAEAEAREVSAAQQENERRAAIRKQIREERVRRAQVLSAAEAVGVSGSSVEASTIGSGQTITAAGQAFATGASLAAARQSDLLQIGADARSRAQFDLAQGQLGGSISQLGQSAFTTGLAEFPTGGGTT